MPVWFSVQATPAKAFSVFPNLLCKQGTAGSSPATSTNYIFFNEIISMFSRLTTCYLGRGLGVRITSRPPLLLFTSPRLMLHFRLRTPRHFQEIRSNNTLDKRDDGDNQMKEKDDDIVHPGNPKKTLILAQFSNSRAP